MNISTKIILLLLLVAIMPPTIFGSLVLTATRNTGEEIDNLLTETLNMQTKNSLSRQAKSLENHLESQLQSYANNPELQKEFPDPSAFASQKLLAEKVKEKGGHLMLIDLAYKDATGAANNAPTMLAQSDVINTATNNKRVAVPINTEKLINDSGTADYIKNGENYIAAYQKINWQDKIWYLVVGTPEREVTMLPTEAVRKIDTSIGDFQNYLLIIIFITVSLSIIVGIALAKTITPTNTTLPEIEIKEIEPKSSSPKKK